MTFHLPVLTFLYADPHYVPHRLHMPLHDSIISCKSRGSYGAHVLLYLAFFTIALDRAHYQNINLRLMVFTKKAGLDRTIIDKTGRGVTEWTGIGAFTNKQTHILITCINKYEYNTFLDLIHTIDPQAFIISDENVRINGNFEKRL